MHDFTLNATKREETGKKVKALRKNKILPAVIYDGKESVNIKFPTPDFNKIIAKAGSTSIINIFIDGAKDAAPVLMQETQLDQRTLLPLHISFHKVNLNEEITATIPVEITGESPAVKAEGGIVVTNIAEIEVRALPQNLPHAITVDISSFANIGDDVLLKDIVLPKNVELASEDEDELSQVVVTITAPTVEPIEEEATSTEIEDIELSVEKGKKEEAEDQE